MIIPETSEAMWLRELHALPPFETGTGELVIVSPHPDDETLGAGALISSHSANGRAVTIIAVTDGENAYDDVQGLAAIRIREQEEAVTHLGAGRARVVRLGLTDSGVSDEEHRLVSSLSGLVKPESHVIAPWTGDFHPDHEACGRAAALVARQTGARLSWYFFWTWHRGTPETISHLPLRSFSFTDDLLDTKWQALLQHKSQLHHRSGQPILPGDLLAPARRNFEVFADA